MITVSERYRNLQLPMPYAMPVHRTISVEEAKQFLTKGARVKFKKMEIPVISIAVTAEYNGKTNFVGFVPKGMLDAIDELIHFQENIIVSINQSFCHRLAHSLWLNIDFAASNIPV